VGSESSGTLIPSEANPREAAANSESSENPNFFIFPLFLRLRAGPPFLKPCSKNNQGVETAQVANWNERAAQKILAQGSKFSFPIKPIDVDFF
jgi:hypothetical protein